MRILVIDDEECIRDSISIYLSERGYLVETASSPLCCNGLKTNFCSQAEACADVILIDQLMPEVTGIEYLANRHEWGCRSRGQHQALMSGFLSENLKQRALGLGCKVFEKPVSLLELEAWLVELAK